QQACEPAQRYQHARRARSVFDLKHGRHNREQFSHRLSKKVTSHRSTLGFTDGTQSRESFCPNPKEWFMSDIPCSWCNDRSHVRPGQSRRELLYVGLVGGLGLTLGNFLGLPQAHGEAKTYVSAVVRASYGSHIFL